MQSMKQLNVFILVQKICFIKSDLDGFNTMCLVKWIVEHVASATTLRAAMHRKPRDCKYKTSFLFSWQNHIALFT